MTKILEIWKQQDGQYKCPFCEILKTRKGIGTHIWRKHGKGEKHNSRKNYEKGTQKAWNKGLTKETDERVKENAKNAYNAQKAKGTRKKFPPKSTEWLKALSIRQSLNNTGGKCKWYKVAEQKVQGKWEKKLAEKFEELKVKWYKPKTGKDVFLYGKEKLKAYTPDFYLEEFDLFLEVKGYWWGNDKEKMNIVVKQHNKLQTNLKIIEKKEFEELIQTNSKEELISVLSKCGHIASV